MISAEQGIDVGHNADISALMANFARDASRLHAEVPAWNLSLVLHMLTKEPFEPLQKASTKNLTLKTVFLVSLATAKRCGEIHALRRDTIKWSENRDTVYLYPDPSFISKTALANKGPRSFSPISLDSLSKTLGQDMDEDRSLCPVRAIRFYLKRTDAFRKEQKKLFISSQSGRKTEIAKSTISSWLKQGITMAYQTAGPDDRRLFDVRKVKGHQVRAAATSWAYTKSTPIDKILLAANWSSHNTFTSHYLKNMTAIQDEMLSLGPIIAAQHTA
jgi:integrase